MELFTRLQRSAILLLSMAVLASGCAHVKQEDLEARLAELRSELEHNDGESRSRDQGLDGRVTSLDGRVTGVERDLAELNFAGSPDRGALLDFWVERVIQYVDLGFEGFRCDAAYKVPVDVWQTIIGAARERNPQCSADARPIPSRRGIAVVAR